MLAGFSQISGIPGRGDFVVPTVDTGCIKVGDDLRQERAPVLIRLNISNSRDSLQPPSEVVKKSCSVLYG